MTIPFRLAVCLVVAACLVQSTRAQSLGDAARRAEEERARPKQGPAAKVFTNKDLSDAPPPPAPAPATLAEPANNSPNESAGVKPGEEKRGVAAPAALQNGAIPTLSALSHEIGGGEVLAELTVSREGTVIGARPLRTTPSFTERIVAAANAWRFTPAEALVDVSEQRPGGPLTRAIESRVLVAAVFRPPAVFAATSGETVSDVANASDDVPFPLSIVRPAYPANSREAGVVLVEARVNGSGAVISAVVKASAPGFDDIALDAARQWRFRPARVGGAFVPSRVYIVFGFPMPAAIILPGTPPGVISPTPGVIIPTPGH